METQNKQWEATEEMVREAAHLDPKQFRQEIATLKGRLTVLERTVAHLETLLKAKS